MNLTENQLLFFQDDDGQNGFILRILWVDADATDIVTIDINDSKAFPVWQKANELEAAITEQKAQYLDNDPYSHLYRPESLISEKYRQIRDEAWKLIAPLIRQQINLFLPEQRGKLIQQAIEETGSTKPTLYKYLRMYWQGGQKPNALLPRYDNCGGKGQKRHSTKKLGRPSQQTLLRGKAEGINVDAKIRLIIERSAKKFHEKQGLSLKDSHQKMLETAFSQTLEDREGNLIPLLLPSEQCPTLRQFCYWYYKQRDLEQSLINRQGQRRYNLKYRQVTGDASEKARFPGALWQIDSTIADIYCLSSLDRSRIIGRPVLYLIVDVFSRLIVGFSLSLEGPSWLGASLALLNATTDKVQFCQEFGITIEPEDWSCQHLCKQLQTDRGSEYLGQNAREAMKTLNIELAPTPAYRPDWKPFVERLFRTLNDEVIHWQPGSIYQPRERGDTDYRLEAIYTLNELRKILIERIIYYNNYHWLDEYPLTKEMIEDQVNPCPRDLWEWGLRNCGRPRSESADIIRLNLLHRAEATVTAKGICFRHPEVKIGYRLRYTCELALLQQWFIKARIQGTWRIPIAYDPRTPQTIYLLLNGGKQTETCHLLPASKAFNGCNLEEVLDHLACQTLSKQDHQTPSKQAQAKLNARLEGYKTEAQEKTQKAHQGKSKASLTKAIRSNRQDERELERIQSINSPPSTEYSPVIPLPTLNHSPHDDEDEEEYIAPHRPFDKLRQAQKQRLKDD